MAAALFLILTFMSLMQKLPVMVHEPKKLPVLFHLMPQVFPVIAVFLYTTILLFHSDLLVLIVVKEPAFPCLAFFFRILTCLLYIIQPFLPNKLVFLTVAVGGDSFPAVDPAGIFKKVILITSSYACRSSKFH